MNDEKAIELLTPRSDMIGVTLKRHEAAGIIEFIESQSRELAQAEADCAAYREALTELIDNVDMEVGTLQVFSVHGGTVEMCVLHLEQSANAAVATLSAQSGRAILDRLQKAEDEIRQLKATHPRHQKCHDTGEYYKEDAAYKAKEGQG